MLYKRRVDCLLFDGSCDRYHILFTQKIHMHVLDCPIHRGENMKIWKSKKNLLLCGMAFVMCCLLTIKIYERYQLLHAKVDINAPTDVISLYTGETYHIEAHVKNDIFSHKIVFKSDQPSIGEVNDQGELTGLNSGQGTIHIGVAGSKYQKSLAFIVKEHVYKIKVPDQARFEVGQVTQLSAYDETMQKEVLDNMKWSTSDESIAKIDDTGKLEGLKAGKVDVYLSKDGNVVDKITVEVKKANVVVSDILIKNGQKITMKVGEQLQLNTQVTPKDATNAKLNYVSSNKDIVDIDQKGMMSAKKSGKVTITVSSQDQNVSKKIQVIVKGQSPYIDQSLLQQAGIDQTSQLMIVAHPDDETLWGGGHLSQGHWFVVCLTNGDNSTRAREYRKVLNHLGVKGIILSYPDLTNGQRDDWTSVKSDMLKDLQTVIQYKKWEMIVTHNPEGEYGHIHHQMTSARVTSVTQQLNQFSQLYYFGTFYKPDAIPGDLLVNLSQNEIDKKRSALNLYTSQISAIDKKWAQMIPYEHWRKASE